MDTTLEAASTPVDKLGESMERGLDRARGSVKGRLVKSVVSGLPVLVLIPPVGGHRILCELEGGLAEKAEAANERNVTLYGLLRSREGSPYPECVDVEEIEIHPSDDQLPTLRSLRGTMRDATNGKSAVEFVRGLRDE